MKKAIQTSKAPSAIGSYSQAIMTNGSLVFLSGQIPIHPDGRVLSDAAIQEQIDQVLKNLQAVSVAAGGCLDNVVKLTVYLIDLNDMEHVNTLMAQYFDTPFPARAAIQVSALPKGALVEIEGVLSLP